MYYLLIVYGTRVYLKVVFREYDLRLINTFVAKTELTIN